MKKDELRHALIEGTIHTIAERGLDKTTTKALSVAAGGCNEVYIYRLFDGKEDLLSKAFSTLDEELLQTTLELMPLLTEANKSVRERFWTAFCSLWRFMLNNKERCIAFIRYYYSPYFERYSAEEHRVRYEGFVDQTRPFFREDAHVWMIIGYIFSVMMDFAAKVFSGSLEDSDDTSEHVFRVVYEGIKQYFKSEQE